MASNPIAAKRRALVDTYLRDRRRQRRLLPSLWIQPEVRVRRLPAMRESRSLDRFDSGAHRSTAPAGHAGSRAVVQTAPVRDIRRRTGSLLNFCHPLL